MTLALVICLALVAWTGLPLPLAVVVGRLLRDEGAALWTGDAPVEGGPRPALVAV